MPTGLSHKRGMLFPNVGHIQMLSYLYYYSMIVTGAGAQWLTGNTWRPWHYVTSIKQNWT